VRRNPSTVVVLAGPAPEGLLAAVGRAANVVLVRPEEPAVGIEAAAGALRRAAGISAPYVLVAADPLAAVAAAWRAMWEVSREPRGSEEFELRAAEAVEAWRAGRFELPDYYLVLAEKPVLPGKTAPQRDQQPEQQPDFYLGPLRSVRPHRVAVAAASEPAEQAVEVLSVLGSLRQGRWWPPADEIIATARGFYPGALAESGSALATGVLPEMSDPIDMMRSWKQPSRSGGPRVICPGRSGCCGRALWSTGSACSSSRSSRCT
jgi:hypothetical protein